MLAMTRPCAARRSLLPSTMHYESVPFQFYLLFLLLTCVFHYLDAPETLVLMEGSSYQLSHRGGAPGADVRYTIDDASIATLNNDVLTAMPHDNNNNNNNNDVPRQTMLNVIDASGIVQHSVVVRVLTADALRKSMRLVGAAARLREGGQSTWRVSLFSSYYSTIIIGLIHFSVSFID
jgi:hypothetical protein